MSLENTVALITGGSRGIGKAIVEALAKEKARVTFTYNRSEKEAADLEKRTGATAIKLDVRNVTKTAEEINKIYTSLGNIDLLVNNAGVYFRNELLDSTEEIWDTTLDTNLKGSYFTAKAAIPKMSKKGMIINIASDAGVKSRGIEYGITKIAMIYLTKALSLALNPNIRVNCICPSYTDTDMAAWNQGLGSKEEIERIHGINKPEDVAKAVISLAESEHNGRIVIIKGGKMMYTSGNPKDNFWLF